MVTTYQNSPGAHKAGNFAWLFEYENVKLFYLIDSLHNNR